MAKQDDNVSRSLFPLGLIAIFSFLSFVAIVAAITFMQPDDAVVTPLAGLVYLCGMASFVRARSAAVRQSEQGRLRFNLGIVLLILAPLSLWAIVSDVGGISSSSCWGLAILVLMIAGLAGMMANLASSVLIVRGIAERGNDP
jgi:hypothetical protein